MRKLLLLATSLLVTSLSAQVTIGSAIKPRDGALLDLKENDEQGANSTKGLGLPRVQLTTILSLDDIDTALDKDEHVGLTIYVPKAFENSCPGVYTWTGTEWGGLNTDASRAPEFITVNDIDGNKYTAKIFNRKGCLGGTYWFTSNLRTTRFNDGTLVASTKNYDGSLVSPTRDDKIPMFFADGRTDTWEIPPYDAVNNTNYFDETNTKFHVVRTKSDISTSTASDKMIEYYENGVMQRLTQDQFVTKFGLLYIYNMAFEGDYKGTVVERNLLCPQGWKIPATIDWLNVAMDTGAENTTVAQNDAAEYLGVTDYLKPIDEDLVFVPENMEEDGYAHAGTTHPVHGYPSSWFIRHSEAMSKGQVKKSGLNVYPVGRLSLPATNSNSASLFIAHGRHFGSTAYFLNIANGALYIRPHRNTNPSPTLTPQMGGSIGDSSHASVRCIKVVE